MNNKGKIAIYSRKSKFTGKGESIENQIQLCKDTVIHNYEDYDNEEILVFEDEGYSGKNLERPQFKEMMRLFENNELKAIVCYKLDRISRSVGDFSVFIEKLEEKKVAFISRKEKFDTSNPTGKAMLLMVTVFAQLERETIAERVWDNMYQLAKMGRWLGGTTPTGYESVETVASFSNDGKKRTMHYLRPIENEKMIVKKIYSKFLEYNSLTKVEYELRMNEIYTKNNVNFSRFAIKGILQNPVYMIADHDAWNYFYEQGVEIFAENYEFDGTHGIMAYNKTIQISKKSNKLRDISEWIVAIGKHQGFIDGKTWVKVQSMLKQNSCKSFRKPKNNRALLSGLLFCGKCGSYMRPKMLRSFDDKGNKKYSYLCETKEKTFKELCGVQNVAGNKLDEMVCEEIKKLSENPIEFLNTLALAKKSILNSDVDNELVHEVEQLQMKIKEKEEQIENLIDNLSRIKETRTVELLNNKMIIIIEEKEKLEGQLKDSKELLCKFSRMQDDKNVLADILKVFGKSFDTLHIEEKRSILRMLINKITWDGKKINVYLIDSK